MLEKRYINEYLFYEFGFDIEEDEERIGEDYPYKLSFIGEFQIGKENIRVFNFIDNEILNVVLRGNSLSTFEAMGMELEDLYFQKLGSWWIGNKNPIDLNTSKIGYDNIPPVNIRRQEIEKLAVSRIRSIDKPIVLEGLYLLNNEQYLTLIKSENDNFIVGTEIVERIDKFFDLSPWRLLSWGVGRLVHRGILK